MTVCQNKKAYSLKGHVSKAERNYLGILFENNQFMKEIYPEKTRDVLEVFRIDSWVGDFFNLNTRPITRYSFSHNQEEISETFIIQKDRCISCGKCLNVCPQRCIRIPEKAIIQENCLHCGACEEVCPNKAIRRQK
ncbi:MAG: 4Fe-4S binding protein [Bacilli bacterium]